MVRPLCIHLHFYQPPRFDPFSGEWPIEYGSAPYRNFNEKICAECYQPNAENGNINRISFNLGPTLADWMQTEALSTYEQYLAADQLVSRQYGVGNAIAQAYNHTILPLLPDFDKRVQVQWGISDFVSRFGRQPLGFWLSETAVDMSTLSILVEQGIRYVFLAPWQLRSLRDLNTPHRIKVGHRQLVVFPYNDALTRVLISYKKRFSFSAFSNYAIRSHTDYSDLKADQGCVSIAADAEFFGHHLNQRERLLARIIQDHQLRFPFEFLDSIERLPEAELNEHTSWTCFNSLARWRGSCNMSSSQCIYKKDCCRRDNAWTEIFWNSLAEVREDVYLVFFSLFSEAFDQPEALILNYVANQKKKLDYPGYLVSAGYRTGATLDKSKLEQLLEAIYYVQLMFTSCGFFFEDIDRLEPKNNLKFLKKAVSLVSQWLPSDYEANLLKKLTRVKSDRHPRKTAADFY